MSRWSQCWILVNTGLVAFLRFPGLFANTFSADEALFATWARYIAVWRDPLLMAQPVDKPPLLFYLQAAFYPLQGPVEWAARLPNFVASLLLVPLVGLLAWRLYGNEVSAVLAATFITLSPYTIQFSPTALTDPLLTTLLITSMLLAVSGRRRVTLSGIFFGLALMTKYQAVLFLPLMVALAFGRNWRGAEWQRWLMGLAPIMLLLFIWEWVRTGMFSLWSAQIGNFGGLRLIWSWELWPRLLAWLNLWQAMWGSAVLGILFLLLIGFLWRHGRFPDQLFILFIIAYMALHWFLAIPVWDRYLLPLVPLVAILVGHGVWRVWRKLQLPNYRITQLPNLLLITCLILPALLARNGRYPIGGQPTADAGTAQIAQILLDAPYGTVLYDHWYSWQWRYHFFDKGVFVNWFPSPEALREDLLAFGQDGTRYLVAPQSSAFLPVQRAVATAAYALTPIASDDQNRITLYRIDKIGGVTK